MEVCEVVDVVRINSTGELRSIWGNILDQGLSTTGRADLGLQRPLVKGIGVGL